MLQNIVQVTSALVRHLAVVVVVGINTVIFGSYTRFISSY